jgi:hypothetical protein
VDVEMEDLNQVNLKEVIRISESKIDEVLTQIDTQVLEVF